ncbi:hypothetical protein LPJ58_005045, partial [Coemansia sp. RSA 1591]
MSTTHVFRLELDTDAQTVELLGTFGSPHWSPILMTKTGSAYEASVDVQEGTVYAYKFRVDGEWVLDSKAATAVDADGIVNSVFEAKKVDEKLESSDVSGDGAGSADEERAEASGNVLAHDANEAGSAEDKSAPVAESAAKESAATVEPVAESAAK